MEQNDVLVRCWVWVMSSNWWDQMDLLHNDRLTHLGFAAVHRQRYSECFHVEIGSKIFVISE